MRTICSWLGVACFGLLVGCGGGGGDGVTPLPAPAPVPAPAPAPGPAPATAPVTVTVVDTLGRFVAGASVAAGVNSASTDASGRASLPVATGAEQVLAITKPGFAEQFKVVNLPAGTSTTTPLQAMLIERAAAVTVNAIEAGGSATGALGVKVTFPANALVNAAGQAVSGAIQMSMTPVNVAEVDVGAFPSCSKACRPAPRAGRSSASAPVNWCRSRAGRN